VIVNYRTYQLPWELSQEQDERFVRLVKQVLACVIAFSIVVPLMPLPEPDPAEVEQVPPRFAKLLLEKPPAPPPPKPVVQPKPEQLQATPQPVAQQPQPVVAEQTVEQARDNAARAGLLPFAEQLADLRDTSALNNIASNQSLGSASGDAARVERSLITASTGRGSGGINTAGMSRNTGGGGLAGRSTTQVSAPVAGMGDGGPRVVRGGGGPSRSREEIELVFDKNKGSIFALYNRALRRDPTLQGKLVLRLTIEPSGVVSDCEVVSSELGDAEMERKLVQRVKMFRFEAKDVARVTTTKPIDFFPA
jgi:TonB family protein